jgi:hypothetical protein
VVVGLVGERVYLSCSRGREGGEEEEDEGGGWVREHGWLWRGAAGSSEALLMEMETERESERKRAWVGCTRLNNGRKRRRTDGEDKSRKPNCAPAAVDEGYLQILVPHLHHHICLSCLTHTL